MLNTYKLSKHHTANWDDLKWLFQVNVHYLLSIKWEKKHSHTTSLRWKKIPAVEKKKWEIIKKNFKKSDDSITCAWNRY